MPQIIIFDFDGTIADTLEATIKIYNKISLKYGLEKVKTSEKEKLRNLGARELIKRFKIPALKIPFLIKDIRSGLKKDIQSISLIKGMGKLLNDLKRKNIEVGIVTSNSVENVELFLKKQKIKSVGFIHSESSLFGKDKVLSHVIQQRGIDKEKVVYVGDEVRDVEAAQKAKIPVIAVTWGFNSEKRLKQSKPSYLVSKPEEILEKLNISK